MPRFIPIETLLDSTFGTSELYRRSWKLNEYGEPLFFLAGREATQHRPKKGYCVHP